MWEHLEVDLDYLVRRATFCGWKIGPRTISNYELVFVIKGQGEIVLKGEPICAKAGHLFCFRPNEEHSLIVHEAPYMEFYGVHFTPSPEIQSLPLSDVLFLETPYRIETLFKELHDVYRQKPHLGKWRQNLLLQEILYELFSLMHQKSAPAEIARVKKALDYIHANPFRSFTLEELLQCTGVKKTLFLQSFRHVTDTTPMQYITNLRLENARDLLLETSLSIAQVAEQCGFSDAFYFSRCFKKHFSASPQQYRQERL